MASEMYKWKIDIVPYKLQFELNGLIISLLDVIGGFSK